VAGMTIFEHIGNRVLGNVCFLVRHAVLSFDDRRGANREQGGKATARSDCCSRLAPWVSSHLPALGIFPRHISRVVHVQEQTLTAIEKSQTEKIVVYERCK